MARRGLFGRGRKRDASAAGTTMYGTGRCGMAFWRSVCGPLRSMGLCRSNNIGRGCSGQGASKGMSTIQLFSTLSCCSLAASSVIGCKDLICHDRIVCECVLWRLRYIPVFKTAPSSSHTSGYWWSGSRCCRRTSVPACSTTSGRPPQLLPRPSAKPWHRKAPS